MISKLKLLLFIFLSTAVITTVSAQQIIKNRLIVLSDIEADPDDSQSLLRLLLYSNQIEIEGLNATTSVHQKSRVAPETIMKIIDGYNKVQPNLLKHEPGYPTAQTLLAVVKQGLPLYGKEAVGKGKHSTGAWFFGCYASRYCLWAGRRHTIMADAYS